MNVTANCICEILCFALDGWDLNTAHKLSSKEKKSWRSRDLNPGLLGGKQEWGRKYLKILKIITSTGTWFYETSSHQLSFVSPHSASSN